LNRNKIGDLGARKLAHCLTHHNDTLKTLLIFDNPITESVKAEIKELVGARLCVYNPLI